MTTNTYIGNGIYVTTTTPGIIAYTDVAITNASSPYTALAYDHIIRADASAGAITINLPTAVGIAGKEYHIFRTDIILSTNIITIDANSTETIDSNLTYRLYPAEWVKLESDGANWQVIARPSVSPDGYFYAKGATLNHRYIAGIGYRGSEALLTSTTGPATGSLWAFPLLVSKTTKFDLISFFVTTLASAGGVARAGIYRDNGNCYPGALIFDTGSIAVDAGSIVAARDTTITSSLQVFQPGLYWLAWECGTASPQVRCMNGNVQQYGILGHQSDFPISNNAGYGWFISHGFGALPDPYTAGGTEIRNSSTVSAPYICIGLRPI